MGVSCRVNGVDERPTHPGTYLLFWIVTKTLTPDGIPDQHDNCYSSVFCRDAWGLHRQGGVNVISYLPVQGQRQLLHHNAISKFLLHTYSHLPLSTGQHTHLRKSSYFRPRPQPSRTSCCQLQKRKILNKLGGSREEKLVQRRQI